MHGTHFSSIIRMTNVNNKVVLLIDFLLHLLNLFVTLIVNWEYKIFNQDVCVDPSLDLLDVFDSLFKTCAIFFQVPFLMSELHSGAMFKSSPPAKKQKVAHSNGDQ